MNYLDFFKMFDVLLYELFFRCLLFIVLLVSFIFSSPKQENTTERMTFVIISLFTAACGFVVVFDFRSFALALAGHNILSYSLPWLTYSWMYYMFFTFAYTILFATRTFSRK